MFKKYSCTILILVILIAEAATRQQINPYKVLGVSRNADEKQIRIAYKKLAKGNNNKIEILI